MQPCQFLAALAVVVTAVASVARDMKADDKLPSPNAAYRVVPNFPQLSGTTLGAVSGVAIDSFGNIFTFHRGEHPILIFDRDGKIMRSFGDGLFTSAHGLRIDSDDNVWVTDNANHTVVKFSHDGVVLLTLGEKNVAGEDATHFNKPTDIAFAKNGDFYVTDGYGNSRVLKFDKSGKLMRTWGKKGSAPGEFNLPHAVQLDAEGHVYIGDRENNRIQVFDSEGEFLRQISGLAPFGLFLAPDQTIYVADGRANKVVRMTLDGKTLTSWGTTGTEAGNFQLPHAVTVAADGAVYVTEITGKRLQKFVTSK